MEGFLKTYNKNKKKGCCSNVDMVQDNNNFREKWTKSTYFDYDIRILSKVLK
jgi:hypothetical protein